MHLLLLREQIAQFDVDFAVTDTDLDFSHMRNHMRRIVSGEVSLFALSSSNAVVQMLGRGGPRVVTAQVDSKRDLEQQLKGSCENFIMVRQELLWWWGCRGKFLRGVRVLMVSGAMAFD